MLRLVMAVLIAVSPGLFGQSDNGGIKQDTKDAAHSTANATKKTGRKVNHGTKKVVHKGAHATKKGAGKVEDKTQAPTPK
jgi:phosphosulfolactate synthase (CoM biosynthesis protein A)